MSRPIEETPILKGKDAKIFMENMKNPRKVSIAELERMRKNYLALKAIEKF